MTSGEQPLRLASLARQMRRFGAAESGATAIEYALIAGLIAAVIAGSVRGVAESVGRLPLETIVEHLH